MFLDRLVLTLCFSVVLNLSGVSPQTASNSPSSPLSTTTEGMTSTTGDVIHKNTTQTMITYSQDNSTSGGENYTTENGANYTTITPDQRTLNPNLTLEDIDELLGPMGKDCFLKAHGEYSDYIIHFVGETLSLSWKLCRCYGAYCPNQTKEELEAVIRGIVSNFEVEYGEHTIAAIVSYGLTILVGTVGNILVLATVLIVFRPINVTNMFICCLSSADLLVCTVCVPLRLYAYVLDVWLVGDVACKVTFYLYYALFMCSVFTLTAMSLERWFVICFPMKAQYISTPNRARIIILVVWLLGFILALPVAFQAREVFSTCRLQHQEEGDFSGPLYLYVTLAIFAIPSILMGLAYSHISVVLWQSVKKAKSLKGANSNGKPSSSNETRSRIQVIRMLIAIWVIFVLCWGPFLIFNIVNTYAPDFVDINPSDFNHLYKALNLITMANSAVNPLLYAFLSRQFRQGFVKLITCQKLRRGRMDLSTSNSRVTGVSTIGSATKE